VMINAHPHPQCHWASAGLTSCRGVKSMLERRRDAQAPAAHVDASRVGLLRWLRLTPTSRPPQAAAAARRGHRGRGTRVAHSERRSVEWPAHDRDRLDHVDEAGGFGYITDSVTRRPAQTHEHGLTQTSLRTCGCGASSLSCRIREAETHAH
jgi:hypothetical protein